MNAPATMPNEAFLAALLDRQRAAFLREGPPTLAQRLADLEKDLANRQGHFSDAPSLSIRKAVPRLREPSSRPSR